MCIHVHYNQGCILHLKVNVCKNNCDSKFTKIKTSNCNDNHSHTYINTYVCESCFWSVNHQSGYSTNCISLTAEMIYRPTYIHVLCIQELEVIVSLQITLHQKVNEAFDQIW